MWTDLFPSSQELGVSSYGQVWLYPLPPNTIDLVDRADAFVKQSIIQMVIGDKEDFDSAWKNMQQGLQEIGIEKAEKELTQLIKSRMDFWEN
jgi:putative aldouronate transport system substrate-binding protein